MGSELMPDLPDGWTVKTLVDCTADGIISYGIVQPGQHDENGIPIIRINNFGNGKLDLSNVLKVSSEIESKFSRTRLIGGEVLLTLVGSTGQSLVAPSELAGWNVPRAVAVIRANDGVGAKWINLCLQTEFTKHFLDSRANTTVQKTLNLSDVRQIPIPIPPKNLKAFIETNILSLEEKITLNRQLNQTLEHMAQALFKSWFVDFDPVIDNALAAGNVIPDDLQDRAERRQLQLAKADHQPLPENIRKLFPGEFELTESLGWVPMGWRVSNVGECFDVTMGQSPPGSTYNEDGIGLPFFQGRTDFGFRYPTNRIYCTDPKRLGKKGHTLISVRAPVGDINIAVEDCCIGRGVASAIHKNGATSYTYYSMNQLSEHFKIFEGEGTVFGSINQKDFNAIPLLKQPEQLIKEFEKVAEKSDEKIRLCSESINALSKLRDTLLPKLISGELRIPEAESALTLALSLRERGLGSASE